MYIAKPMSRGDIADIAWLVRRTVGLDGQIEFPVVHFLEHIMADLVDEEFEYEYPSVNEMQDKHGATLPEEHKIQIREDVYIRACMGEGRDRLTIAHEIGHYILHDSASIVLARKDPNVTLPAYRDPEWQANAFGGELLMPSRLVRGMSAADVVRECKVSWQAASYQLSKIK